jgi:hypothetical protein
MGHSRTPTQTTAGDGFPADPIDGCVRAMRRRSRRWKTAAKSNPFLAFSPYLVREVA